MCSEAGIADHSNSDSRGAGWSFLVRADLKWQTQVFFEFLGQLRCTAIVAFEVPHHIDRHASLMRRLQQVN
jgi:hypothetical protein